MNGEAASSASPGAGESIRFDFLDGDVVRVVASDAGFDAIEVLLRAGKIDEAALARRRLPSGKDRALAAREAGLLTERDWRWGERIRAVEILAHLVAWLEGSYAFDSSARPEKGDLAVGIHRLILELFLRSRDRAFVHHALPAVDARLQRGADFDEKFGTLGLTPDALRVAAAIDGRSTAAEISRRTPPDPFSVEKLLAALATLGLLHPEYAAEPRKAVPEQPPEPVSLPASEIEAFAPSPAPPQAPEAPVGPVLPDEPKEKPQIDLPLAASVEPSEPAAVAWEPVVPDPMDQPLDVAGAEIPSAERRSIPIAVWVLLVLAIAVGALLLSRSRETGSAAVEPPPATTPVATAAPGSVPTVAAEATAPVPAAVPALPPTRPPATPSPVPPTPSPSPSPRPRPTLTGVPTAAPTDRPVPSPAPPGTRPARIGPVPGRLARARRARPGPRPAAARSAVHHPARARLRAPVARRGVEVRPGGPDVAGLRRPRRAPVFPGFLGSLLRSRGGPPCEIVCAAVLLYPEQPADCRLYGTRSATLETKSWRNGSPPVRAFPRRPCAGRSTTRHFRRSSTGFSSNS